MDIIYLSQLKIETIIGIYDWERKIKQLVCIDLEMGTNIQKAATTDSIQDTLDYKAVAKRIISFVEASEFQLVESMAEKITQIVMQEFQVPWVKLRLAKPGAITGSQDVGILIERGNKT